MDATEISPYCPRFQRAVEVIGRRWTGAVVRALMTGSRRFSEIADTVPGISDRLLSERLKELEAEDIVERVVVPSTPVRVDYRLTAKGRSLFPVLFAMGSWGSEHLFADEPELRDQVDAYLRSAVPEYAMLSDAASNVNEGAE